jgi:hypothetical protein
MQQCFNEKVVHETASCQEGIFLFVFLFYFTLFVLVYVNTSFYYVGENTLEETQGNSREEMQQVKLLKASQTHLIYPLNEIVAHCHKLPPENFRCWRRYIRHDYWVGLMPVMLKNIKSMEMLLNETNTMHQTAHYKKDHSQKVSTPRISMHIQGTADCLPLSSKTGDLSGSVLCHSTPECCSFDQLFCEECSVFPDTYHVYTGCISRTNVCLLIHFSNVQKNIL